MRYEKSKKLIKNLLEQENKNTNDNTEIFSLSKIDFLFHKLNNNIYFIDRNLKDYTENLGSYNKVTRKEKNEVYNSISIHLDTIKRDSKDKYEYIYNLLTTLYHEYYHRLVYLKKKDNQIENFQDKIENYIKEFIPILYNDYHDNFSFEITADLYSFKKTEQYLKKYPNIYNKLKNKLEYEKLLCQINNTNYDLQSFLNYIHKTIINNNFLTSLEAINILYNQEYKLKSINELLQNKTWISQDEQIKNTILSSKSYLDNQDIGKLSQKELKILLEALKYSYYYELNRYEKNKELHINFYKNKNIFTKEQNKELKEKLNKKLKNNSKKIDYLKHKIQLIENKITATNQKNSKKLTYKNNYIIN